MVSDEIIGWLLKGDVSIQYQVYRDLLSEERDDLRARIATEGWGAKFLSKRKPDGHWGLKFYQPKWTSTHYTLLDLRNLCISPDTPIIKESIDMILENGKGRDGGVEPSSMNGNSDVCINGMFLNYATYFLSEEEKLKSIVDFLLSQLMEDGGFNCRSNRSKAVHSSLNSTLSVLEGISDYEKNGYQYRLKEMKAARESAIEFLLLHQLFISDRTGKIISKNYLTLSYPGRWRYDILKALDYLRYAQVKWDDRLAPAIEVLLKKRNKDQTWNTQAKHPGEVHFEMEKAGRPGRWNTLRALRVLKYFDVMDELIISK
ncbi:MAG: prenyltransferase/squalene oxidase repeat-containing protein [Cyclobacteriaceae bacterium]